MGCGTHVSIFHIIGSLNLFQQCFCLPCLLTFSPPSDFQAAQQFGSVVRIGWTLNTSDTIEGPDLHLVKEFRARFSPLVCVKRAVGGFRVTGCSSELLSESDADLPAQVQQLCAEV